MEQVMQTTYTIWLLIKQSFRMLRSILGTPISTTTRCEMTPLKPKVWSLGSCLELRPGASPQVLTEWFSAPVEQPQEKRLKVETGSLRRRAAAAAKHLEAQKLAKVRMKRYHLKLRESVLL